MHPLTSLLDTNYVIAGHDRAFASGRRAPFTYALPSRRAGYSRINPNGPDPSDQLAQARSDLAQGTDAALVNAVGNAKRAVHQAVDAICRLQGLHGAFGRLDFPGKLALLSEFGALPSGLVSGLNKRRNLLEHLHSQPSLEEASEAVEVAELFLVVAYRFLGATVIGVFTSLSGDSRCFEYVVEHSQGVLREFVLDIPTTVLVEGVTLHVNIPPKAPRVPLRSIVLDKGSKATWLPYLDLLAYCTRRDTLRTGLVGPPGYIATSAVSVSYPKETGLPQPAQGPSA